MPAKVLPTRSTPVLAELLETADPSTLMLLAFNVAASISTPVATLAVPRWTPRTLRLPLPASRTEPC